MRGPTHERLLRDRKGGGPEAREPPRIPAVTLNDNAAPIRWAQRSTLSMTHHPAGELSLTERALSTGAGLFLAAVAAKPRPNALLSILALAGGAALAYRGATGYCPMKAALAAQQN